MGKGKKKLERKKNKKGKEDEKTPKEVPQKNG